MHARINSKGQVVIPVELWRKYGITTGTKFVITDDGERIILMPITPGYLTNKVLSLNIDQLETH